MQYVGYVVVCFLSLERLDDSIQCLHSHNEKSMETFLQLNDKIKNKLQMLSELKNDLLHIYNQIRSVSIFITNFFKFIILVKLNQFCLPPMLMKMVMVMITLHPNNNDSI